MSDAPRSSSPDRADQSTRDRIKVPADETFTVVANALLYDSRLTTHEKLLAIAIRSHCHGDAVSAWPSNSRLCEIVGCHKTTLLRAREGLEQKGYLTVERRAQHESNIYTLSMRGGSGALPPGVAESDQGGSGALPEKNKRKIQEENARARAGSESTSPKDQTPTGSLGEVSFEMNESRQPAPSLVSEWRKKHPGAAG